MRSTTTRIEGDGTRDDTRRRASTDETSAMSAAFTAASAASTPAVVPARRASPRSRVPHRVPRASHQQIHDRRPRGQRRLPVSSRRARRPRRRGDHPRDSVRRHSVRAGGRDARGRADPPRRRASRADRVRRIRHAHHREDRDGTPRHPHLARHPRRRLVRRLHRRRRTQRQRSFRARPARERALRPIVKQLETPRRRSTPSARNPSGGPTSSPSPPRVKPGTRSCGTSAATPTGSNRGGSTKPETSPRRVRHGRHARGSFRRLSRTDRGHVVVPPELRVHRAPHRRPRAHGPRGRPVRRSRGCRSTSRRLRRGIHRVVPSHATRLPALVNLAPYVDDTCEATLARIPSARLCSRRSIVSPTPPGTARNPSSNRSAR